MAELVGAKTWAIQGSTVTLPVVVHDAVLGGAVFGCPAAHARKALAGTALRPLTVGGRACSVLMCIRYREFVLGSYDEVGIGLLARGPRGRIGLVLLELPVTGEFTREAGRDFWGLPKWLMSSAMSFAGRRTTAQVTDGADVVLRAELIAGRAAVPFRLPVTVPTWAQPTDGAQAGRLLRGGFALRLGGLRFGRGAAHVAVGTHRMGLLAQRLGMTGRPWLTVSATSLTGSLDAPRALHP